MQNFRFEIGKTPFGFMSCPRDRKTIPILHRVSVPSVYAVYIRMALMRLLICNKIRR